MTDVVFQSYLHFFRSALKRFKGKKPNSNLLTLVLVPQSGQSITLKFDKSSLLDTVRQSIALQTGTPKNRIRLQKSGQDLSPCLTIRQNALSDNDYMSWSVDHDYGGSSIYEKVFCIGLFKTGTSSIARALNLLGYRSYHAFGKRFSVDWDDYWNIDDSSAFRPYYSDIKRFISEYDAFSDAPWMYLYRELDQWFPGSKYILTTRDAESLAESEIAQCIRNGKKPDSVQRYIDRYNRHNQNVIRYFKNRPQGLLIFDVKTGWPALCEFLKTDIPILPFPHENRRPGHEKGAVSITGVNL